MVETVKRSAIILRDEGWFSKALSENEREERKKEGERRLAAAIASKWLRPRD